ncbi:MAG: hypothetical protein GVY33_07665 [Alphaproteobacteria bacterium]|jgi:uncharacterized alpha-E superfamily protein|nr:hypothetical protein [Alphaproteobacteria bacterium]
MSTLSRTAADLFWMARYLERAESMARLVEMGARVAMLPARGVTARDEWRSVALAAGCDGYFDPEASSVDAIILGLVVDRENPSSIASCFERARANARSVRTALSVQAWESLNETWLRLDELTVSRVLHELPQVVDWVKGRCAQFRGAADATLLRDDRFEFARLGLLIERADTTLRLLDVKHFVLLPETQVVGGDPDRHRWTSILVATSALRAYHWVYRGDYSPERIVDLLLLNGSCPRSYAFCYGEIVQALEHLARLYGARHACHTSAAATLAAIGDTAIGDVFHTGLHGFLTEAIGGNNRLSREIATAYHF